MRRRVGWLVVGAVTVTALLAASTAGAGSSERDAAALGAALSAGGGPDSVAEALERVVLSTRGPGTGEVVVAAGPGDRVDALIVLLPDNVIALVLPELVDEPVGIPFPVFGLDEGESLIGIDVDPRSGGLFGVSSHGRLHRVDLVTLEATPIGSPFIDPDDLADDAGVDVDPTTNLLRVVDVDENNVVVHLPTGGSAASAPLTEGSVFAVTHDRNFHFPAATTLFGIDSGTDGVVRVGGVDGTPSPDAGVVTPIGALGVDVTSVGGVDTTVLGRTWAVLGLEGPPEGEPASRLFDVDLVTGAATEVGPVTDLLSDGEPPLDGMLDVTALPFATLVVGAGRGGSPHVRVIDAQGGTSDHGFFAYNRGFKGGVRVATGDVNRDGIPDAITGPGPGGGPHVRVFDGRTGGLIRGFFAFSPSFRSGLHVGSGDIDGDGFDDVVVGAGAGGGPWVKVFSGATGSQIHAFRAFGRSFRGGVQVAAGDVDGDGFDDIVVGAGRGGGPRVKVFSGRTGAVLRAFMAYDKAFRGGVFVAAGDIDRDLRADIVTGPGSGGGPHVRGFSGRTGVVLTEFFAAPGSFRGGIRVAVGQGIGLADPLILTGPGRNAPPEFVFWDPILGPLLGDLAFSPAFRGGIYVALDDQT